MIENHNFPKSSGITLVLSGDAKSFNTTSLLSFWQSFIELQRKLPTSKIIEQIVMHCWDPSLNSIIQAVYSPQRILLENQEILHEVVSRYKSTSDFLDWRGHHEIDNWEQNFFYQIFVRAYSRASAARLMEELPLKTKQVLIANFISESPNNQGSNLIIADSSLPEEYIYLPDSPEVDYGYLDTWVLSPWSDACNFRNLDQYFLDSLDGKNDYLNLLISKGWPRARVVSYFEHFFTNLINPKLFASLLKIIQKSLSALEGNLRGDYLHRKLFRKVLRTTLLFLSKPQLTGENSFVVTSKKSRTTYSKNLALDIRPLFKYFILQNEMRDRVRFLNQEDFQLAAQSGQLINPPQIILVIYEDVGLGFDSLISSPLHIAAIYEVSKDSVNKYMPINDQWISTSLLISSDTINAQMDGVLRDAGSQFEKSTPLLLMKSINQYLECNDWLYLNALVKYVVSASLGFVNLNCSLSGKTHHEFPNLNVVKSSTFVIIPCAGTIESLSKLFSDVVCETSADFVCESKNSIEFLAVSLEVGLYGRLGSANG